MNAAEPNTHQLAIGTVFHRRRIPKKNVFTTPVYMLLINLNQVSENDDSLSIGKLSHFAPEDYWQKSATSVTNLQEQIIDEWKSRGLIIDSVRILTNPRSLNTSMNPLSIFYCYRQGVLVAIIAEVTNTPWGERHHYFLVVENGDDIDCTATATWNKKNELVFNFDKAFHVSPFNPMEMGYKMKFTINDEILQVFMHLVSNDKSVFDAILNLALQPLTAKIWRQLFWRHPWLTMQIRVRIYFEALKLFVKGSPLYPHPKKKQ